jgi:benzoyl-CoA reductase/2-hydroxyglutaryl-CoA dehydratase subunit BcrC/BadD/HgdB
MSDPRIGITSTIPVEAVLAAGLVPVDLNNRFIAAAARERYLREAEARGFPANVCSWIKGIYAAARAEGIRRVVGVTRGDCSSTEKLLEIWRHEGVETIPFDYPAAPSVAAAGEAVRAFAARLGTTMAAAEAMRERLRPARALLRRLDELTWREGRVSGGENHLWLVSASDFNGDPARFETDLRDFLARAEARLRAVDFIPLGYAGVPPIVDDLHAFIESRGARVVFNETQRQFAMLGESQTLAEQYAAYTYPYDTFGRIEDIGREAGRRGLLGVIHYAQTFCHRGLEGILLRERLGLPLLCIEADRPGPLDPRTATRIEAFLEQLRS